MGKKLAVIIVFILLASTFTLFVPQVKSLGTGPVGYWRFDEGSGTTAIDSSGKGNTGQIHGAQWIQGVAGKALRFDGIGDYVSIPHSSSLDISGHEITVEYWLKFPNGWYAGASSYSQIIY